MKIAFLCGSGQPGGAERCMLDMIWSVRRADPRVEAVIIVPAEGPFADRAAKAGVTVVIVPYPARIARLGEHGTSERMQGGTIVGTSRLLADIVLAAGSIRTYARQLTRVLRDLSPDVVHSHALKMHVLGAIARPATAALVWHFHEGVSNRPVLRRYVQRAWRSADASVGVSPAVAADVTASSAGRLHPRVVLNGIDLCEFAPEGPAVDLDGLAGLPPAPAGAVRIGIVGMTGRFKGQDVFLRAIARLSNALPIRAYVIGGPVYVTEGSQVSIAQLKALSAELGIGDRCAFTGFVNDVAGVMRALDIVVHATVRPEPFGLVIVEAMACGRAVIVSEAGGASEIADRESSALTHPPGDVDALAAAIGRLVSDKPLRDTLAVAGLTLARARFDRTRMGVEMLPVYADALAHARTRTRQ